MSTKGIEIVRQYNIIYGGGDNVSTIVLIKYFKAKLEKEICLKKQ